MDGKKKHCSDALSIELGVDLFDYLPREPLSSKVTAKRAKPRRNVVLELPPILSVTPHEVALFEAHFASFLDELLSKGRARDDKDGAQAD